MAEVTRLREWRGLWGVAALAGLLAAMLVTALPASAKDAGIKSELQGTKPAVSGLELEVSGGDRFLLLRNGTGKQVIVKGYEDEPYLRFLPNKVVEENLRSPSKYANEDRYALTPLPAQANSDATPKWQAVSRNGSYRWFDHRIHLMEKGKPPQVKDEAKRTKIFNWDVPMTIGGQQTKALGTLEWVPESSSDTSPLLFVGLGVVALLIGGGALALMRRRSGAASSSAERPKQAEEAW